MCYDKRNKKCSIASSEIPANVYFNSSFCISSPSRWTTLPESFHSPTSYSQCIVSAVVLSASTTEESFILNSIKAKWLFYSGLCGQGAFPLLALKPRIAQDAIEGGEGRPTPMLAVSGLAHSTLDSHTAKTNEHLPDNANAKLYIGLHNGAKNDVIVGPAHSLYGLVTALRKIRAPAGADQSKVPYSQHKDMFTMRFLLVNVPHPNNYLQGATDKVFDIDLEGKELWTPDELAVPVFHTENGALLVLASDGTVVCFLLFWTHHPFFVFIKAPICVRLLLRSRACCAIRRSYTPYIGLKPQIFLNPLRTLSTLIPVGLMEMARWLHAIWRLRSSRHCPWRERQGQLWALWF